MYCMKCGRKLEEGTLFCTQCGHKLEYAPQQPVSPAAPVYGAGYNAGYAPKKRTGLIVGLSVGGAVLVIAVILLLVLLPGGANAGIAGTWYSENGLNGTVDFRANGTFEMNMAGLTMSGDYKFDSNKNTGRLSISYFGEKEETSFKLDGDRLNIDGVWYTKEQVQQMDYSDMLDDFNLDDFGF